DPAGRLFIELTFCNLLQIGTHARGEARLHFDVPHRLAKGLPAHLVTLGREKSINDISRLAGILLEVFADIEPSFQIFHHRSWIFLDELRRSSHEDRHRVVVVEAHHGSGDSFGFGDGAVRVNADERVDGFGRRRSYHLVHVHLDLLIILLLQARAWRNDVHERVTRRRTHLVADLQTSELLYLRDIEFLPRHHPRALPHLLDLRDCDQPALVVAGHEGLAGVSTEVHLPRHHLLHGEIAGG